MDYKEKYEQALKRAKELLEDMDKGDYFASNGDIENIFPELKEKESEDEKIRKAIHIYLDWLDGRKACAPKGIYSIKEMLAWLEKQGENKPTDKVEPKFKTGDWIIFNGVILHIDEVVNGYYRTTSRGDGIHNSYDWNIDNAARLWTIQEAKDGDVLVNGSNIFIFHFLNGTLLMGYCHINTDDGRFYDDLGKNECFCLIDAVVTPASKEQRDLLFRQMKEEGYEWDSEKKELKKVEPKKLDADKVIA